MLEVIATILVGTGLLLYGMKILETESKQLTGRRLRMVISKWTSSRLREVLFGFISGVITHSGSSASLIITNLIVGRFINIRNAILLLAAANVGTVAIAFLFAIDLKLGIMYLLGISAMLYSLNKKAARLTPLRVLLGIGILLFGFIQLEVGAEHLIEAESMHNWLLSIQEGFGFYIVLILLGFGLRLLTRSSSTVAVLIISLGHISILDKVQLMFMVAGAPIAAGIAMIFESKHVKGSAKQIPAFQIFFEISGGVMLLGLLGIEAGLDIPLIKSAMSSFIKGTPEFVAATLLLIRLIPFIITVVFHKRIADILEHAFPAIKEETLSNPQYIYDQAVEDPDTAIELVDQEISRIMMRFPGYLENVRTEHESIEIVDSKTLHSAAVKLGNDIDLFIGDLFNNNLSQDSSERLLKIQNRHSITMMMEENIYSLVNEIKSNEVPQDLNRVRVSIVESLHAVLVTCMDSSDDKDFMARQLIQMTSDKGSLMQSIRTRYLSDFDDPSGNIKKTMMYVTDLYQRIIWLVNKWAQI